MSLGRKTGRGVSGGPLCTKSSFCLGSDARIIPHDVVPAIAAGAEIARSVPSGSVPNSTAQREANESGMLQPPGELQPPQPIGGQVYVRQAPVPPTPPAVQVPQAREPSPEERRLIAAYQREQQAIAAPTTSRQGFGVGTPTNGPTTNNAVANVSDDAAQIAAALQALTHQGGASQISPDTVRALVSQRPQNGDGSGDYEDQNMQNHKEAFLSKSRTSPADDYLKSTRTPPRCRENLDFNGRRDGAPTSGPCEKAYVRCSEPPR